MIPSRSIVQRSFSIRTCVQFSVQCVGRSMTISSTESAQRPGSDRGRAFRRARRSEHRGAEVSCSTPRRNRSAGHRRASGAGAMSFCALQATGVRKGSRRVPQENQGERTRPEPPGQPTPDRSDVRHPIRAFLGPLTSSVSGSEAGIRPNERSRASPCSCRGLAASVYTVSVARPMRPP